MDYRWYFTKEQLENSPSRKCGMDADKELSQRQQAANFIQDMGQRLQVTQLCINTAIVYMHRFYVFHSFTSFHRTALSTAALFLAAKVEEQPRKLEHIIKVSQLVLQKGNNLPERRSDYYAEQAHELVMNENLLLQTLGFDVAIDHPHTYVVRCCHLVRASKDLSQTSYFMASNSLHLTTMCLLYKPTVVACFCIHLACKWSNWEIPKSNEGRNWFEYIDANVNKDILEKLTSEFLTIFDKCPSRLKKRIMLLSNNSQNSTKSSSSKISATYNAVDPEYDQLINPVPSSTKNNDSQHGSVTFNPVSQIQSGTKSNMAITGTVPLPANNNSFVHVQKTNNTVVLPSNSSIALSSSSKHPVNNIYSNNSISSTSTGSVVKPIVPPKINNNIVQGYVSKLGPVQANNNNFVVRPSSDISKLPASKPSSDSLVVVPPTSSVSIPRQRKDYGTTDPNIIKNVVSEVVLQNISNKSEPPPNNIDNSATEIDGTKLFMQGSAGAGTKTHSIFSPHPVIANTNGNVTSADNKVISIDPKWELLSPKCDPVSPPDSPPIGHHHHHENNEKRHKTKKKDKHKEKRHKEKKEKHRHHKHHHRHNNEDIGQKEPTTAMAAEGIKIKIPKEKLIDIPSSIPKEKLIIKINKDQLLATPSSSSNYFKVKINKESKKSRKRNHSSSYKVEDDVSDNHFNNSYEHNTKKVKMQNFSNR